MSERVEKLEALLGRIRRNAAVLAELRAQGEALNGEAQAPLPVMGESEIETRASDSAIRGESVQPPPAAAAEAETRPVEVAPAPAELEKPVLTAEVPVPEPAYAEEEEALEDELLLDDFEIVEVSDSEPPPAPEEPLEGEVAAAAEQEVATAPPVSRPAAEVVLEQGPDGLHPEAAIAPQSEAAQTEEAVVPEPAVQLEAAQPEAVPPGAVPPEAVPPEAVPLEAVPLEAVPLEHVAEPALAVEESAVESATPAPASRMESVPPPRTVHESIPPAAPIEPPTATDLGGLGASLGFAPPPVVEASSTEAEGVPEAPPRTPPPESGPQASTSPPSAALDERTASAPPGSGPTMEQLGTTIELEPGESGESLELAAPSTAETASVAEDFEEQLPSVRSAGVYDESLAVPGTAQGDLEAFDRAEREKEARRSAFPSTPPAESEAPPPAARADSVQPEAAEAAPASAVSATEPWRAPDGVIERSPVPPGTQVAVYHGARPVEPQTFGELLDRALALSSE